MSNRNAAPKQSSRRVRRTPDEAKRLILDAAERQLLDGGPDAVRVRVVAAELGITDAAIHYHFSSRQGLVEAVIHRAGRRVRDDLTATVAAWRADELDLGALVERLRATMEDEGQSRLTAWMVLTGWRPEGRGLLRPVADAVHDRRSQPAPVDDTLFAIALIGLVTWGNALMGDPWRRSVGLPSDRATSERFLAWTVGLVDDHLGT